MNYKINITVTIFLVSMAFPLAIKILLTEGGKDLNGFKRKFIRDPVPVHKVNLSIDPNMIAGLCKGRLWVSDMLPGKFMVIDTNGRNVEKIQIGIFQGLRDSIGKTYACFVNDSLCLIYAFNIPAIVVCNLITGHTLISHFPKGIFLLAEYIGMRRIAIRKYFPRADDFSFYTFYTAKQRLVLRNSILPANHDGGISTDGQLHWDDKSNGLVYHYFYSGRWCTMDSLFSNVEWYPTIDTIRRFRIKLIRQGNYYTTEGDSQPVNSFGSVYDGKLYLLSTVRADNEKYGIFERSSTIDIYDIFTGKYKASFHIPVTRQEKPLGFQIYSSRIYVLTKSNISMFDLP